MPARRLAPFVAGTAVVALEIAVARGLTGNPKVALAAVGGALGLGLALWRPRLVFVPVVLTLGFIPVTAAPQFWVIQLEPTAIGLSLVALACGVRLLARGKRLRLTMVDSAVLVFFVLLALPVLAGVEKKGDWVSEACLWLGPYLGVRLYLADVGQPRRFERLLLVLGVLVVPFVLLELATGSNVFNSIHVSGASKVFGNTIQRFGAERAQAAFGQPIALAMFLATTFLLALGFAIYEARSRARTLALAIAGTLLLVLTLTLSRTGFVVVAAGVVLLAVGAGAQAGARSRFVVVIIVGGLVAAGATQLLPSDRTSPLALLTGGSSESAQTASYRAALLQEALRPGTLTAFGDPRRSVAAFVSNPKYRSVDNAYLSLAQDWGLVSMGGFVLVLLSLCGALWRLRRAGLATLLPAITIANFVGLFFVALITQQQIMIWMLIGASAALLGARARHGTASAGGL